MMNYTDTILSNKYLSDMGLSDRIHRPDLLTCSGQRQNHSIASVSHRFRTFRTYVFEESWFFLRTPSYDRICCICIQILAFLDLV